MRTRPGSESRRQRPAQEVEVKYRIFDSDAVLAQLAAHGVRMSAAVHQDDQAYAPVGWTFHQPKIGVPFARLRTQEGRHLFAVKSRWTTSWRAWSTNRRSSTASRCTPRCWRSASTRPSASSRSAAQARSVICRCVEEVEHAGAFLEVEWLVASNESGEAAQRRLDEFVRSLDVPVERTTDTYDSLLRATLPARV